MDDQIILRNVMRITDGRLDLFCKAVAEAVDFVERHGPQLLVRAFIDREGMRATSFQIYRNSADVLRHWAMSDPHIQNVSQHCVVETLELYGNVCEDVRAGISVFLEDGRGRIIQPLAGFIRF